MSEPSGTFELDLEAFAKKVEANADTVIRKVAADILSAVIERTPVDTGRLRGNWQTALDAIRSGELIIEDKTGSVAIQRANQVLALFSVARNKEITFANNLPYAAVVEYGLYPNPPKNPTGKTTGGYSRQAPAGMVRITMQEAQSFVSDAVRKIQ